MCPITRLIFGSMLPVIAAETRLSGGKVRIFSTDILSEKDENTRKGCVHIFVCNNLVTVQVQTTKSQTYRKTVTEQQIVPINYHFPCGYLIINWQRQVFIWCLNVNVSFHVAIHVPSVDGHSDYRETLSIYFILCINSQIDTKSNTNFIQDTYTFGEILKRIVHDNMSVIPHSTPANLQLTHRQRRCQFK